IFAAYTASFYLPATLTDGRWMPGTSGFDTAFEVAGGGGEYFTVTFPLVVGTNLSFFGGLCCLFFRALISAAVFGLLGLSGAVIMGCAGVSGQPPDPGLSLGPGFYLWAASMLALILAGLIGRR